MRHLKPRLNRSMWQYVCITASCFYARSFAHITYILCVYIFKWISRNIHSWSVFMHSKVFEYMLTLYFVMRQYHFNAKIEYHQFLSHVVLRNTSCKNYKTKTITTLFLVYALWIVYFTFEHPFVMRAHTPIKNE